MPLLVGILSLSSTGSGVSFLIVEVDVDRLPRGFFKGPKWVSLNSMEWSTSNVRLRVDIANVLLVRFQDMISGSGKELDCPKSKSKYSSTSALYV